MIDLLQQIKEADKLRKRFQEIEQDINNNNNDVIHIIKQSCPSRLHDFYETVCDTYAQRLIGQLELNYDEAYWVSNEIGEVFAYGDFYFLRMSEIILLVDNGIGFDEFNEWYNQWTDFDRDNRINLRSWIMGARPEIFKEERNE